jgi:hypothetical protein
LRRLGAEEGGLAEALSYTCRLRGRRVVFLLDDFDQPLSRLPARALRELRSLRDQHKYHLAYVAALVREPANCLASRLPEQGAGPARFAELFDGHVFPLRPYSQADAEQVMSRKSMGWEADPTPEQRDQLYRATGGHARLLVAGLVYLGSRLHLPWPNVERGLCGDPGILAACRALWEKLEPGEQLALWHLAREQRDALPPEVLERLRLRGLVRGGPAFVFSSLFERFAAAQSQPAFPEGAPPVDPPSRLRDPDLRAYW